MRHLPLLALLALPLPALAQTEEGGREDRGFLTGLLEDALSDTARTVTIEGFAGALSSRATIEEITIADSEGVWLRAEDLALQWNRSGLLGGRIDIQELSAAAIEVIRPPVADPSLPQPEATPFSLPELPVSVQIGTLQAERIVLDESLLGERLVLSLGGQVDLAGGEGTATLAAEILEGSEGSLRFDGGYSNETRILALDLDLREAEGGLAARALDLPGLPSIALSIEGTAPIDDYQAELSLATAGEPRVTGTFALQTTDDDPGEGYVVERAFGLDLRGDVTPLVAPEAGEFLGDDVRLRAKGIRRSDGSLVLTSLGVGTRALELGGKAEITPEGWPARIDLQGRIGAEDGLPVRLPGLADTTVGNLDLELSYDRAEGEEWTGTFAIADLARPGLSVAALTLEGGGEIRPASGDTPGRFTADLGYAARGLAFADASLGEALGADLTGEIDLVRGEEGGPLRIRQFTLSGPGLEAQAEGTVAGGADGLRTDASVLLQAGDLGRFAELTGLDLGGAADVTLVGSIRPLDGIFDLILSGTTQDLALGVEALDPFLAGDGRVTVAATRDETGLTIDTLEVATDAVTATGEANVTSGASEARFDLAVSDLDLAFPDLPGAATIRGTFDRAADGSAVLDAEATLPGARIAVDATQAASTATSEGQSVPGPFTFAAEAAVEELGRFQTLLSAVAPDLPLAPSGAATLRLEGTAAADLAAFDVAVDATTRDLALGIAPLDATLAGEGSLAGRIARIAPDALRIEDLRVRTDLLEGTVTADLTGDGGRAELDIALADVEPVLGGVSGPGRVAGTAGRAADGTTALDLALTLPTGEAAVRGTLAADAESFTGDLTADLSDIAPLGALAGRDLGGAVQGRASGTVRTDLATFDLDLDVTSRDLRLGIPQADAVLAGDGSFAGRIARTGPESFIAEDLRIATDLLSGTVTADLEDGVGTADVDLALADVAPVLGGLSGPGRVAGTARRGEDGATDLDLALTLPTGTAQVEGALILGAEGAFDGTVTADFADIAPLGALVGRDLGGAVEGTATGTARLDLSAFDLAVGAATEDLRVGIEPVDALLAGDGAFDGRVARTGRDSFVVEDLTLDTDLLSGTVTAAIEDGVGTADVDLALADVAPVLGGLSGPGRVTGTARQAADGTTALDLSATLPTGTAQVEGTISGGEAAAFDGTVTADFADIAPLGALVGRDLGGAVEGSATGTARLDLSAFDLAFEARTQDLGVGQPLLDPLLAGPGTFSGQVARDAAGNLTLDIDADTPLLRTEAEGTFGNGAGSGRFDVAIAEVAGLVPGLSGPATAAGTASRAADGTIAVDAVATAPGARLDVDATVAPPAQGYEVTGTADVQVADLSLLAPFVGRPLSGGIDATVSGSLLPSLARYDLTVDGTATDLSPGDPTLARLLAGTGTLAARVVKPESGALRIERLSADFPNIAVTATGDAGGLSFDARLADLGLFVPEFPGPVSASGTASLGDGGAATVDAQVTGPGGISARVAGTVGGGTVDLRATGDAPLALANRFIDPRRLEGPASFDLRLAGASLDALSGTVSVESARLSDPSLGEAVTAIAGTATIAGGQATLDLSGALALGGALRVAGPVALSPPFEAALQVTGTDLVIRDPELYEAFGDARLAVTGPLAGGALISGVVELSRVEGRVPSTGVGALGDPPEVFHIEPSPPVVRTLERAGLSPEGGSAGGVDGSGAARAPYGLDILLRAPAQVFVRGRGLDAELGGELRLTGTTAQIIPIGQFSLLRGRLDLLGQRFDLTEGSATIQGSFDAFVRLVARTTARTGTEIAITLEGPLSAPEVSFESNPDLPEDEVLAQLLFGVDIASVTPLQAIRLASAVAELAGGGTGLVDEIRGGAGLADFDLTTTESGNVALRLGRYISENVYTDVVVSPEETEATINLDLTPDLTVRAGVTTEGETTLGIFFERDY